MSGAAGGNALAQDLTKDSCSSGEGGSICPVFEVGLAPSTNYHVGDPPILLFDATFGDASTLTTLPTAARFWLQSIEMDSCGTELRFEDRDGTLLEVMNGDLVDSALWSPWVPLTGSASVRIVLDPSGSLCAPGATIPPDLPAGCDLDACVLEYPTPVITATRNEYPVPPPYEPPSSGTRIEPRTISGVTTLPGYDPAVDREFFVDLPGALAASFHFDVAEFEACYAQVGIARIEDDDRLTPLAWFDDDELLSGGDTWEVEGHRFLIVFEPLAAECGGGPEFGCELPPLCSSSALPGLEVTRAAVRVAAESELVEDDPVVVEGVAFGGPDEPPLSYEETRTIELPLDGAISARAQIAAFAPPPNLEVSVSVRDVSGAELMSFTEANSIEPGTWTPWTVVGDTVVFELATRIVMLAAAEFPPSEIAQYRSGIREAGFGAAQELFDELITGGASPRDAAEARGSVRRATLELVPAGPPGEGMVALSICGQLENLVATFAPAASPVPSNARRDCLDSTATLMSDKIFSSDEPMLTIGALQGRYPGHCFNGTQDVDEVYPDCGPSCPGCPIDLDPPVPTFLSPLHGDATGLSSIAVRVAVSEPVTSVTLNGSSMLASGDEWVADFAPVEGQNELEAVAIDLAGNVGTSLILLVYQPRPVIPEYVSLLERSALVARGTVDSVTTSRAPGTTDPSAIRSVYSICDLEVFAGGPVDSCLDIELRGGLFNDEGSWMEGQPVLMEGDELVFFLTRSAPYVTPFTDDAIGIIRLFPRSDGLMAAVGWNGALLSLGSGSVAFGERVVAVERCLFDGLLPGVSACWVADDGEPPTGDVDDSALLAEVKRAIIASNEQLPRSRQPRGLDRNWQLHPYSFR